VIPPDDPAMKAEMLLLSASMRVPSLDHDGMHVWDTLAIGEYLQRDQAQGRPAARRPQGARALPRHLRRDAFGLQAPCAARCR
jgi:glutathione S-transferase